MRPPRSGAHTGSLAASITTAGMPRAFELLQGVPTTTPVPQPDRFVLDQIVATLKPS
jgi:hypothetical protein